MKSPTDRWDYDEILGSENPKSVAQGLPNKLVEEIESVFTDEDSLWEPALTADLEKTLWKLAVALVELRAEEVGFVPISEDRIEAELFKSCAVLGQPHQYVNLALYMACGWREKSFGGAYFRRCSGLTEFRDGDDVGHPADLLNIPKLRGHLGEPPDPTVELMIYSELIHDPEGNCLRSVYRRRRKVMLEVMKGMAPGNAETYCCWGWTVAHKVMRAMENWAPEFAIAAIGELALWRANGISVIR